MCVYVGGCVCVCVYVCVCVCACVCVCVSTYNYVCSIITYIISDIRTNMVIVLSVFQNKVL